MAGSYRHCESEADPPQFTFDLIDDMGDAEEAAEMMFWMLWFLAEGDEDRIRDAEAAYYAMRQKR